MSEGRYTKGTPSWVEHPIEGRVQVVFLGPIRWTNYPYTQFQMSVSDTLTTVAQTAYGHATDYWFVASMNPQIICPDDVQPGDIIRVPTGKIW